MRISFENLLKWSLEGDNLAVEAVSIVLEKISEGKEPVVILGHTECGVDTFTIVAN